MRRKTANRFTLVRKCYTCGKEFLTTADSPFMRVMPAEGRKYKTCYFCSRKCRDTTRKYICDGCGDIRHDLKKQSPEELEKQRIRRKKYYAEQIDEERKKNRERYWRDPEAARASCRYSRAKRKAMEAEKCSLESQK